MSNLYLDSGEPANGKRKVFLATPSYDSPDASYTFSIARSREVLHKAGIKTAYLLLQGNCHIDDSRNSIVRDFLESDCTEMVFLDADVSWEPEHLLRLCEYDCDIVGGVYPFRRESGKEGMPVRNMRGAYEPDENGLLEVEGLPTGFMRIRRHVLETMAAEAETFTRDGRPIPLIFQRDILDGGRRGGDIRFCMRWRELGGRIYAAANLRLGHCGKSVIKDTLAASLRRQMGTSLAYVADRVREGKETHDDLSEAIRAINNPWCATQDVLSLSIKLAREARKPIIEAGSGLTTVLMAAANPDIKVWCMEHSEFHSRQLEVMAQQAGVFNIAIVQCPLSDGWYDLSEDMPYLPDSFSVGLVDGPPRQFGDRMRFFDVFGDRCDVILADDADDKGYTAKLSTWAESKARPIETDQRAAVILQEAA